MGEGQGWVTQSVAIAWVYTAFSTNSNKFVKK